MQTNESNKFSLKPDGILAIHHKVAPIQMKGTKFM